MTDNSPTLTLGNPPLHVYAARDGDHVTGRVVFPHETYDRTEIPIDYRSRHPPQNGDSNGADLPPMARLRYERVCRYDELCAEQPDVPKRRHAEHVVEQAKKRDMRRISVRSLQMWARKVELHGPQGLIDNYDQPARKVLECTSQEATAAVQICAWWAYRCGNLEAIDNAAVHTAVAHLVRKGFLLADVLATIEIYYTADIDRWRYPFMRFSNWARYHFTDWLCRAANTYDFVRGLDAARRAKPTNARRRDAAHPPTRRAIKALDVRPVPPPNSQAPSPNPQVARTASALRSLGLRDLAKDVISSAAPGIPAVVARPAGTLAETLSRLEPSYRRMLLDAARGDPESRKQALVTLAIWWPTLPQEVRKNMDYRADVWRERHPRVTEGHIRYRKLDVLLSHLRRGETGAQRLAVAARIPV